MRFVLVPYMRRYSNDSRNAALAAWAAWEQDRFWEMHDLLFENAPELERPVLEDLARKLGLDLGRFRKALDGMAHLPELQENLDRVHDLDIWSTPTVIINGRVIKGAQPYENYREVIEEALKEKTSGRGPVSLPSLFARILGAREARADGTIFGQGKVPLYVRVPDLKPTNEPRLGEEAPDFSLPGTGGRNISLGEFRGKKNVLLTFLPAAFTPV